MEIEQLTPTQNLLAFKKWSFSCEIPCGRQGIQPMQYKNEIFFFSGRVSSNEKRVRTYANDFWKLDLDAMEWHHLELKGDCPSARMNYTVVVCEDIGYLYGGCDDGGVLDSFYSYNFESNVWKKIDKQIKTSFWPPPLHAHNAVIFQNEMFIFGGASRQNNLRVYYNNIWKYNFVDYGLGNNWELVKSEGKPDLFKKNETKEEFPRPRSYHSTVVVNDCMFTFGGFWMETSKEFYLNDSWIFSFTNKKWQLLTILADNNNNNNNISENVIATTSSTTNKNYSNKNNNNNTKKKPVKVTKSKELFPPNVPCPRNRHSCVQIENNNKDSPSFLIFAGNFFERGADSFCSDAFICQLFLNEGTISWKKLDTKSPPRVSNHYCVFYNEKYYVGFGEANRIKFDTHFVAELK